MPPSPAKANGPPTPTNDAFEAALPVNERILKNIYDAYAQEHDTKGQTTQPLNSPKFVPSLLRPKEEGILAICRKLDIPCIAPRRKINVMIVGNHSAGKSSYVNWYIGEHVMRTAVAIETQGFTFCTSGKKRDTYKGQATMKLFTHLKDELECFAPAIYNGLQTEISTSKERCFSLITFIDTPGLVDGSFQYPFPVEDAILAVAKHTDLIYIFFDPIGQALCDRTMNVIDRLNQEHAEKLRYFLSKADTVPNERDRQKVVVQITQNLSSRVRNAHAFELPSLYIPDYSGKCKIENILDQTCEEMQQTINQSVQNNLNKMEKDCLLVNSRIEQMLADDLVARKLNRQAASYGYATFLLSLLAPMIVVAVFLHRHGVIASMATSATIPMQLADVISGSCDALVAPTAANTPNAPEGGEAADGRRTSGLLSMTQLLVGSSVCFVLLQLLSMVSRRYKPCFSKRELSNLVATQKYVTQELLELKKTLYATYLEESSSDPNGML